MPEGLRPAPWQERLQRLSVALDQRQRQGRLDDLKKALEQTDPHADPDTYRAIQLEYRRLYNQRPDTKSLTRLDPSPRA
jgi:hypothetical protein